MPYYIFEHPDTGEIKEVLQRMNDDHIYEENGIRWKRVFTKPATVIDSKFNPSSSSDFVQKTLNKKGSVGDLVDLSKELSEKRKEQNGGIDPVQQKHFEDYAKKHKGKKHPEQRKEEVKKRFKDIADIDF